MANLDLNEVLGPEYTIQITYYDEMLNVQPSPPFEILLHKPVMSMFTLSVGGNPSAPPPPNPEETFESVAMNLKSFAYNLVYSGVQIVSKVYSNGIIKTLSYGGPNGLPNVITLSGLTPAGISLIKTIGYTGNQPTSVVYS